MTEASANQVADRAGVSPRHTYRCLHLLEDMGLITSLTEQLAGTWWQMQLRRAVRTMPNQEHTMTHLRTDPACIQHRPPRTPWGVWWFDYNRGRACLVCERAVQQRLRQAWGFPDALAAAVERVRALHGPRVVQVLGAVCSAEECDHEDACPLVDYTVCGHCYDVGDGAHPYAYEEGGLQDVAHPCATYRALDATQMGGES